MTSLPSRRRNADQADVEDLINQLGELENVERQSEEWTATMYLETMSKNQTLLLKYNEINAYRNNLEIELEDLEVERDQLKVPR